jgi:hypothetical protein
MARYEIKIHMSRYTPPKPAPLPADFDEFYASLTPEEKELHALATDFLGSSYFIQWTHMYTKWKKSRQSLDSVPKGH